MTQPNPPDSELVVSFLTLRKAIGIIGIAMPIVVRALAYLYEGIPSNDSISAYYYTVSRDVFVGTLFAIGVFLFCYRDRSRQDNILTNVAGLCAVAIGLFPTDPKFHPVVTERLKALPDQTCYKALFDPNCYTSAGEPGYHIYVVVPFFLIISYLTLFRFTKPGPHGYTDRKKKRNRIYVACGIVMFASLGVIVLLKGLSRDNPIYVPETVAIIAFGIAWLTKGHTIMGDRNPAGEEGAR
jgi:hypothetical protein